MTNHLKRLKIGFDFDGVIAYSPTRLIRAPISFVKKKVLKKKGVSFFVPKNKWHKLIWAIIFGPSVLPEKGMENIKDFDQHRLFLITGRFDFLEKSMVKWLKNHKLTEYFECIYVNREKFQPHEFKTRVINKLKLDYYVEDNWDAVEYLNKHCPNTKILWIYNIVDRSINYPIKFPNLGKALEYVRQENSV